MVLWFLCGSSKLYEAFQLVVFFVFWVCNSLTSLLFHLAHCLGLHCWTWWRIQLLRVTRKLVDKLKEKPKSLTPTVCWSSSSVMRGILLECFGSACPFRGKSCSWKSLQCWNDQLYSLKELYPVRSGLKGHGWIWWSRNDANRILCLLSCVCSEMLTRDQRTWIIFCNFKWLQEKWPKVGWRWDKLNFQASDGSNYQWKRRKRLINKWPGNKYVSVT